jgi:hypothetical protein
VVAQRGVEHAPPRGENVRIISKRVLEPFERVLELEVTLRRDDLISCR